MAERSEAKSKKRSFASKMKDNSTRRFASRFKLRLDHQFLRKIAKKHTKIDWSCETVSEWPFNPLSFLICCGFIPACRHRSIRHFWQHLRFFMPYTSQLKTRVKPSFTVNWNQFQAIKRTFLTYYCKSKWIERFSGCFGGRILCILRTQARQSVDRLLDQSRFGAWMKDLAYFTITGLELVILN